MWIRWVNTYKGEDPYKEFIDSNEPSNNKHVVIQSWMTLIKLLFSKCGLLLTLQDNLVYFCT